MEFLAVFYVSVGITIIWVIAKEIKAFVQDIFNGA